MHTPAFIIMNKIVELIIHALGGVTLYELQVSNEHMYNVGYKHAYQEVKIKAESINGTPSDMWCDTMYKHFCTVLEHGEDI